MAKYFTDLERTTERKSQRVQQFNKDCTFGGGFFNYFDLPNAGIKEVLGVRVKVAGSAIGYYERIDITNGYCVDWFGVNGSTALLSSYVGMTQNLANSIWGVDELGNYLVDIVKDTYDTAAFKYAFNQFDKTTYKVYGNSGMNYKLSDTVYFPKSLNHIISTEVGNGKYEWDGNMCIVTFIGNNNRWGISTKTYNNWIPDLRDYNTAFQVVITNTRFRGDTTNNYIRNGIKIEGGRLHRITYNKFYFLDACVTTEFGQITSVDYNHFTACNKGITFDISQHSPNAGMSQSNVSSAIGNHFSGALDYGIKAVTVCNLWLCKNVFEGATGKADVLIDGKNSGFCRGILIQNHYCERTCTDAAIVIDNYKEGNIVIENAYGQIASYLVRVNSNAVPYGEIIVRNVEYWLGKTGIPNKACFLQRIGTARWIFENIANLKTNADFQGMFHAPTGQDRIPVYSNGGSVGGVNGQYNYKTPVIPD